ncbi:C2 family cysteine protease [Myxococcota bacterium]|nr:C2 family cysteine protease [Myxococcota bacterium]
MAPRIDFVPRPSATKAPELPEPTVHVDGPNLVVDATPGAIVEALNTTRAPTGYERLGDTVELGRADQGKWIGRPENAGEGDRLRLRARMPNGRVSPWVRAHLATGGVDETAAFVNLARIRLVNHGDGRVSIVPASRMPVTEDDADLRFTVVRTGRTLDAKATPEASLPEGLVVEAQTGDAIDVAVSDGAGNEDFAFVAGRLVVPPPLPAGNFPDPRPLNKDRDAMLEEILGELFAADGVAHPEDVKQGAIANCYVPGALAAVAEVEPEAIDDMIEIVGPGKSTVRLYPGDGLRVDPPVFHPVDFEFYTRGGRLLYEQNPGAGLEHKLKLWVPLIGKAIAQQMGQSYEEVAKGGSVGAMMSMILGRPNREVWTNQNDVDAVWTALVKGREERRAMAAGTYGVAESQRYRGTGVYANHAYSVHGAYADDAGQRWIVLRNPWASGAPNAQGRDDGVFPMPIERFCALFQVLNVC